MWNRNEACPTTIPMKSWHRSKLKVTLPILLHTCYLESNRFFLWRFQRCVSLVYRYTVRFININQCFTMSWNLNLPQENLQVASNYKQDYSRALLLKPRSSFYAHQYYSEGSDIVDRVSVSCACLGDCWCNLPYLWKSHWSGWHGRVPGVCVLFWCSVVATLASLLGLRCLWCDMCKGC